MKKPDVSVILTVYNPGSGLQKCIEMLRAQTLENIEIIFVDDRGTDGSMEAIREAAAADGRIRILTNPENLGAGAARNHGIEEAKGEYLSFIDPDDYPERNFLELLYRKTVSAKPDIVKGDYVLRRADGTKIKEKWMIPQNTVIRCGLHMGRQIYDMFSYPHWTAIYRRDFLLENGIRYGMTRNSQDTTFLLRAGKAAKSIAFEDRAIYNYVSRDDSRMHDFTRARLQNELDAFDDLMREMRTADDRQYNFYHYISGKIHYLLTLHAVMRVKSESETEAEWFLARLREKVVELPWIDQIMEKNQTVRTFVLYGANLSLIPYKAQGVDNGLEDWVYVVRRVVDFLKEHPEEGRQYGWMLKRSYRTALAKCADRNESKEARQRAYHYLKGCPAELPEPGLLTAKRPSIKLFLKTGVNLVPAIWELKYVGKLIGMKVVDGYLSKRDRKRRDRNASDKARV